MENDRDVFTIDQPDPKARRTFLDEQIRKSQKKGDSIRNTIVNVMK